MAALSLTAVAGCIAVGDGTDAGFRRIITEVDRKSLGRGAAVRRCGLDGHVVARWLSHNRADEPSATVTTPVFASIANRPPASSVRLNMSPYPCRPHRWPSAVTPTAVPLAALSETLLPDALLSVTAPTLDSDVSSLRLIAKVSERGAEPSAGRGLDRHVVCTWRSHSRATRLPSATVTTPVLASMVNRPPASSVKLNTSHVSVLSASVAKSGDTHRRAIGRALGDTSCLTHYCR